jgi:hypothetical protein
VPEVIRTYPARCCNEFSSSFHLELSDTALPIDVRVSDADVVRSENNILQWMSYLPEDCIKAMIAMGVGCHYLIERTNS